MEGEFLAGVNIGLSGDHPGKVCLIRLNDLMEPVIVAVLEPDAAQTLGLAMARLASQMILNRE